VLHCVKEQTQCPLQITHACVLLLTARKRQTTMQTKTSPRICVENHCKMTFHRLWSISWHSPYRGQVPRLFQIFQTSSHPANNYGNEGWSPVSRSRKRESGYTLVDCGFSPVTLSADIQLVPEHGRRHLRSSSYWTLAVPRTRTTLGDRSFADAGPRVWNSLPATLRQITTYGQVRQRLKTHLFMA